MQDLDFVRKDSGIERMEKAEEAKHEMNEKDKDRAIELKKIDAQDKAKAQPQKQLKPLGK